MVRFGMQELLLVVVIALAVLYFPRITGRRPAPEPTRRPPPLTGRMRLAISLTLFWIAGSAALLNPWKGDALPFFLVGMGPPAAAWGAAWVRNGYKKYRR